MVTRVDEIKKLRNQGYSLQEVGDKFSISRERIRQILTENFGNTKIEGYITRKALARLLNCSGNKLRTLESKGLYKPVRSGNRYLYNKKDKEKIKELLASLPPTPMVFKTCEACGKVFSKRACYFRRCSPGRFCSNRCKGVYLGRHHGKSKK